MRIGNQVGYMMTKYLLFGEAINRQETALRGKISVNPVIQILWYGEAEEENIMSGEVNGLLIVGVAEDRWYWVWDPHENRFGRIFTERALGRKRLSGLSPLALPPMEAKHGSLAHAGDFVQPPRHK